VLGGVSRQCAHGQRYEARHQQRSLFYDGHSKKEEGEWKVNYYKCQQ